MTFRVVVADRVAEPGFALLRAESSLEVVSTVGRADRLAAELERAQALIVRSETQVSEALMQAGPELMIIGRAGVGVDNVDVEAATRRGIAVLNAPGANTVSAAEHTIGLLLAYMRRIAPAVQSMSDGLWDRKSFQGTELRGKTIGLVGLGRIGQHVANVARALGMKVIAHDPFLPEPRAQELSIELLTLEALLPRADVLSLHLPLTDETRHLIGAPQLALMKPSAIVVNTARGALIDDEALLAAIQSERLRGAALDVFEPEPLPSDSPLRRCKEIMLTPHLAASTDEAQERVAVEICTAVRDALLTGSIGGAVNLPGISGKTLARLAGSLELARRLGRLGAALANGRVQKIAVAYGGADQDAPRPVMLAAVEGVLAAMGVSPVSMVNASVVAEDRGIKVSRKVGAPLAGFETTIGIKLSTADRVTHVVGAVTREKVGRIIRVNDFEVDVPADGHVLILRNRDVPGVIGRVGTLLGQAQINIASYHQSRRAVGGDEAMAAIVVDQAPASAVVASLSELADVLEVRHANLNGISLR